jgi:hypothetical protein
MEKYTHFPVQAVGWRRIVRFETDKLLAGIALPLAMLASSFSAQKGVRLLCEQSNKTLRCPCLLALLD